MTPDEAMDERMDGDYTPPIVVPPTEDLPVPTWDPETTLTRKA